MVSITMKTLLLAAFVCLAVANNADKECGENEFLNPCGGCQRSCAIPSPMCSLQCRPPQCECLPDYVRDDEGRCIPESYCPKPCGKNAHWATCSTCQGTCKNPNPFCTKECKPPKCMCDHGFVLNDQGECIPTQAVVAVEDAPRCPANEQWVKCSGCDGTCKNQFPFCTRECKPPKCQCKPDKTISKDLSATPKAAASTKLLPEAMWQERALGYVLHVPRNLREPSSELHL
ncbi:hypothetical protein L596_013910 [Steinernema carpocapsae]|uniref:TIL domain-containing protein n=1 Tax=Steinernema carpocapsae TaxID=34508 RepID=A0A4U5P2C8_STECR|nr:hypothetical protein L596_013910 [Steinernema carpocapsae]